MERITGLDFDRFQKSVLLAQGEFAAFLRATSEDRKALLEKITGTEIYAELEELAKQTADAKRKALEELQARMNASPLLTENELQQRREALALAEQHIAGHAATLSQLQAAAARRRHLDELAETARDRQVRRDAAAVAVSSQAASWQRLESDANVRILEVQFRELARFSAEVSPLQQQLRETESAAQSGTAAAQQAEAALAQAREELEKTRRYQAERMPVLDEVIAMDAALQQSRKAMEPMRHTVAAQRDRAKQAVRNLETTAAQRAMLSAQSTELETWLSANTGAAVLAANLGKLEQRCERADAAAKSEREAALGMKRVADEAAQVHNALAAKGLEHSNAQAKIASLESSAQQSDQHIRDLLRGRTPAALEVERERLREVSRCQEKASEAAQRLAEYSRRVAQENSNLAAAHARLAGHEEQRREAENRLPAAVEREELLRDKLDLERRVVNLEAERARLRDAEPCPVCGSKEHPYAHDAPTPDVSATEAQHFAAQKLVADLNVAMAVAAREIAAMHRTAMEIQKRMAESESSRNNAQTELLQLCEAAGCRQELAELLDRSDLLQSQEAQAALDQQLRRIGIEISEALGRLSAEWEKVRDLERQMQEIRRQLEQAQRFDASLLVEVERLQSRETALHTQGQDFQRLADLAEAHRSSAVSELMQLLAGTGVTLPLGPADRAEIPFPPLPSTWLPDIQARAADWMARTTAKSKLGQAMAEAVGREATAAGVEKEVRAAYEKEYAQLTAAEQAIAQQEAVRTQRFGSGDPLAERKALAAALTVAERQRDKAEAALSTARRVEAEVTSKHTHTRDALAAAQCRQSAVHQDLATSCDALGLTLDAARSALLPQEERERLGALHQQLTSSLAAAESELVVAQARLHEATDAALREDPLSQEVTDELTARAKATEELLATANQEKGRLRGELERDAATRAAREEAIALSGGAEKESARWAELARVLGHGTRKPFSRFAQNLTLARLITLANGHLSRLSDRYRLERKAERDMELEIVDSYHANTRRPIESLSGGETFLASLALALGLSDLASRRVRIDSLFIDEGFGALDADALDIAIGVLENLQARGKMVGIISHVELIRERLSTRIAVRRLGGGFSSLALEPSPSLFPAETEDLLATAATVGPAALPMPGQTLPGVLERANPLQLAQQEDFKQHTLL